MLTLLVAMESYDPDKWNGAIQSELASFKKTRTWEIVDNEGSYMAPSRCGRDEYWNNPTVVYEDNAGTVKWSGGYVAELFRRRKHVDNLYNHVCQNVRGGRIVMTKVSTEEMVADFLKKPLQSTGIQKDLKKIQVGIHYGEKAC